MSISDEASERSGNSDAMPGTLVSSHAATGTSSQHDEISRREDKVGPNMAELATVRTSLLQRKRSRFGPTWAVAVLAMASTVLTVWYAQRAMVDRGALPTALRLSPGRTVLVSNVLSHLVAFLLLSLCTDVLEAMRWALACRTGGVLLTSFLAMSRATPIMGVLHLCRMRGSHQMWAVQRMLAFAITAVLSLVLIGNVTFSVVYTPFSGNESAIKQVFAGLVSIRHLVAVQGSGLTGDLAIDLPMIPMLAATYSMAFLTDPRFVTKAQPVNCTGPHCSSLLLPGGLEWVRTWNGSAATYRHENSDTLFQGNYAGDYDSIVVNNAPSYQFEFGSIAEADAGFRFRRTDNGWVDGDCHLFFESVAEFLYVCKHQVGFQAYLGWTICPHEQVRDGSCQTDMRWTRNMRWNTTAALYELLTTVAYDRRNISILGVISTTRPVPLPVDVADFKLYCEVVFRPVHKQLDWTQDEATYKWSAASFNVAYGLGYLLRMYSGDFSEYTDGGVTLLRSFLAVPYQFATAALQYGSFGQHVMPERNLVTATLSHAAYRALIQPSTVWLFACLSFPMLVYCLALLLWMAVSGPYSPNVSAFPEIDMASRSSVVVGHIGDIDIDPHLEMASRTLEDLARLTRANGLGNGDSGQIVAALRNRRVYCGSLPARGGEEMIVLLTEEAGRLKILNKVTKYI